MTNERLRPVALRYRRLNVSMPDDVVRRIDEVAARYDMSRSALLRYCFETWQALADSTIAEDTQND